MTSILSVEDDPLQAEWIRTTLLRNLPGIDLRQIRTEHEFISRFAEVAADPPGVVLLDAMLRWTDPSPEMPLRPPDVREGGVAKAWLRCQTRLNEDVRTRSVPVIIYSVLQKTGLFELPDGVIHLQKDANSQELISLIKHKLNLGHQC